MYNCFLYASKTSKIKSFGGKGYFFIIGGYNKKLSCFTNQLLLRVKGIISSLSYVGRRRGGFLGTLGVYGKK